MGTNPRMTMSAKSGSVLNRFILRSTLRAGRLADFINRHRSWIQAVAGTLALSLGFWGWMIEKPPSDYWGVLDNVFRTAQLITLQFPNDLRSSPSLPLQIARLAVPLFAVLASFQFLIASVTRPVRLALLPHISGHIVVLGSSNMTEAALTALAARGQQVVVANTQITGGRRATLEGLGLTVLEADPRRKATMRSLHLSRAAAVFLLAEDDVANLNTAMLALPAIDERPKDLAPLLLAVKVDREELAVELDSTFDSLSRRYGVRYHRLSPGREGLRLELSRFAPALLKRDLDAPSHVLIVGLIGDWRQIAMQIIVSMQDHPEKRPLLTFAVNPDEASAIDRWRNAKPELHLVAEISILLREADAALPSAEVVEPWSKRHAPPQLAVVLREDADAIASMLALRRPGTALGTETAPILVHQSKDDRFLAGLGQTQVNDRDMTRLVAIGGLVRAESIERILDRKGDEMAIALHAHYLDAAKTLGAGSSAATEAWDSLPENLRDANRAAVEHAPILLAAAGFRLVPARPGLASVALSSGELEFAARIEHRRWMADRIDRGWRFGAVRDDRLKLHTDLAPYEELSENTKEKDRNSVRVILSVLRDQGLAIVRA
jgi:RyR domain/TrkA-N domain